MRRYIVLAAVLLCACAVSAQQMNIGYVFPTGGERGTTFDVTVGGQNLGGVTGVLVNGSGVKGEIVDIPTKNTPRKKKNIGDEENLQLADRVKVRITIDKNAELGVRDFRLTTAKGYSNRIFFSIGQLREASEKEPNDALSLATDIGSVPVTINGQVTSGERDYISFKAKGGTTLVCSTEARILVPYLADAVPGWFQPVITLFDSNGKEVAFCDDYKGDVDPVIIVKLPKDDTYTLLIHDAIWRGREDFVYRVSIGELPFITSIFPLGGENNKKTKVELRGVNLSSSSTLITPKTEDGINAKIVQKGRGGLQSNAVPFEVSNFKEIFNVKEPSSERSKAMVVSDKQVINGIIEREGKADWYAIDALKGENWRFSISARSLGSQLDAKLTLFDEKGAKIKEVDDTQDVSQAMSTFFADPAMPIRFFKPGRYYLRVIDTQNHGGEDYGYRLHIARFEPEFELRIDPSNLVIPAAGTTVMKISALRKEGFNGEIDVEVKGLPKGFKVSDNRMQKGDKSLRMTITAPTDAVQGSLDLKVVGVAQSATGGKIVRQALPAEELIQAFYIKHLIPTEDFKVTVDKPLPVKITPVVKDSKPVMLVRDTTVRVKVLIDWAEGFNQPINVTMPAPARGITMKPVLVQPGEKEIEIEIECGAIQGAPAERDFVAVLMGQVRAQKIKKTLGAAKDQVANAALTVYAPAFMVSAPKGVKPDKEQAPKSKNTPL